MLSIGKLVAGQHRYYEKTVAEGRDDYYSGRGEAPGEWAGRGAAALRLAGRVQSDQFNRLMEGRNPATGDPLREVPSRSAVTGFDLTFSAPKSVSVLFAVADEEVAGALVEAHDEAVRAALEYVEDAAVFVRRGKGGARFERPTGLVAAAYHHRMSRALDPQLHTHVVCANLAQGPDGRFTALHHPSLYLHAKTAGYLYEAHLRAGVRERLGLGWGPVVNGISELVDVDVEVLRAFSRRRREMLDAAEALGRAGVGTKAQASALAVATRDRKQYGVDTAQWRDEVRARAEELGFTRDTVRQLLARAGARAETGPAAAELETLEELLVGHEGLTARSNTFTERDVLQQFAAAHAQGAPVDEIRRCSDSFHQRDDVLGTVSGTATTADLVAAESRLISSALARANTATAVLDDAVVAAAAASAERPLSSEQAAAVRGVATSGNGVDVIQALAGTGKTYTASVLVRAYAQAGYSVLGVAPTGRAARELADEAGIRSHTLDRVLLDLDAGQTLPQRLLIVIDEAGMAPTRGTTRLLAAADMAGAKVVAIGDPGQLASVRAGGWLRAVGERLAHHRLTEVVRQRDPRERQVLAALHDGQPESYLAWASNNGRARLYEGAALAQAAALQAWQGAADKHGVATAVLIARDNDVRCQLNQAAREHRRARGELGPDAHYGDITLAVGDRVIARRNDAALDVDNGTRGTVTATFADRVLLRTDAGHVREVPAGYVAEHVELAYCLTGHGMQGATVDWAGVVATPHDLTRGWSYTALSRARHATELHIDTSAHAASERTEVAPAEAQPARDDSTVLQSVAASMRMRDDEDLAVEQIGGEAVGEALVAQLRHAVEQAHSQRAALPLDDLRELDRLERQQSAVAADRDDANHRLAAAPPPRRRLLQIVDPQAQQRAHLEAVRHAADRELATLEARKRSIETRVPPDARERREALTSQIRTLTRDVAAIREQTLDCEIARSPTWLHSMLGARPASGQLAEQWERAARALAGYRLDHYVPIDAPALGPRPAEPASRAAWEHVHAQVAEARERDAVGSPAR